tara:strand:+ start:3421 stop:4080 length:660 start_codon:yes stop_codon:yes gene_type:complete
MAGLDHTLKRGTHLSRDEGLCTLELVALLGGEEHTDQPACCCSALMSFVSRWNDDLRDSERQLLVAIAPMLVGSEGGPELAARRAHRTVDWLVTDLAPSFVELAGREGADWLRSLKEPSKSGAISQISARINTMTAQIHKHHPERIAGATEAIRRCGVHAARADIPELDDRQPQTDDLASAAIGLCSAAANTPGADLEAHVLERRSVALSLIQELVGMS